MFLRVFIFNTKERKQITNQRVWNSEHTNILTWQRICPAFKIQRGGNFTNPFGGILLIHFDHPSAYTYCTLQVERSLNNLPTPSPL